MKTRQGFVSNSSSSSFIVNDGSAKEVCRKMLEHLVASGNYEKSILTYLDDIDESEQNILIPFTCNYETFISNNALSGGYFVDTCRNDDWWDCDELDIQASHNDDDDYIYSNDDLVEFFNIDDGGYYTKKAWNIRRYGKDFFEDDGDDECADNGWSALTDKMIYEYYMKEENVTVDQIKHEIKGRFKNYMKFKEFMK